jgi:hypothetical protein
MVQVDVIKEARELEILIQIGNGNDNFNCEGDRETFYHDARSLEKRGLIRFCRFDQIPSDIQEEKIKGFSAQLTPLGLVFYSNLVKQYAENLGK